MVVGSTSANDLGSVGSWIGWATGAVVAAAERGFLRGFRPAAGPAALLRAF